MLLYQLGEKKSKKFEIEECKIQIVLSDEPFVPVYGNWLYFAIWLLSPWGNQRLHGFLSYSTLSIVLKEKVYIQDQIK
jgi:hypothetical protein